MSSMPTKTWGQERTDSQYGDSFDCQEIKSTSAVALVSRELPSTPIRTACGHGKMDSLLPRGVIIGHHAYERRAMEP